MPPRVGKAPYAPNKNGPETLEVSEPNFCRTVLNKSERKSGLTKNVTTDLYTTNSGLSTNIGGASHRRARPEGSAQQLFITDGPEYQWRLAAAVRLLERAA